jgi:hypothetical protein
MMYTRAVSDEPLDIIRLNEAETDIFSLSSKRFRRLFNELEHARAVLAALDERLDDDRRRGLLRPSIKVAIDRLHGVESNDVG